MVKVSRTPDQLARRYLRYFGFTVASLLLGTATLTVSMDPFDVFASQGNKPYPIRLSDYVRMSKTYAIRHLAPDCLILGTSRAAIGYRADHPGWSCTRPYNAAFPGAHIYEARRYLQHALAQGPISTVFLGLDFEMFRALESLHPGFSETRLSVGADGEPQYFPITEMLGLAFGLDAVNQSFKALVDAPSLASFDVNGDWSPEALAATLEFDRIGVFGASRKQAHHLAPYLTHHLQNDSPFNGLTELERIIELCRRNRTDLRIVLNPVHAAYHELLFQLGRYPDYRAWRSDVATTVTARLPPERFRAFDYLSAATAEGIPPADDRLARMRGYWEISHFRTGLGDEIMALALAATDNPGMDTFDLRPLSDYEQWRNGEAGLVATVSAWLDDYQNVTASQTVAGRTVPTDE